ncbi:MAG TPA: redox-regulated ATPase YchF [Methanocorpusculum sp.]|nr:redox-regulated ATPase YchF [Methanocorpusculum sp.]
MLLLALAGKPNCGKSTFFKSLTLANVEIANYPFTTVEANKGVAYVRSLCPCKELDLKNCNSCVDGIRFIPVELLDVAGLVPGAHLGRGLGNQFLDSLREADGIIQVVDASGSTDPEGNPVNINTRDPCEDVEFLSQEFTMWMTEIINKHLAKIIRQAQGKETTIIELMGNALAGLRINITQIHEAIAETGIRLNKASSEDIKKMCKVLLRASKPMVIAANKADQAPDINIARLKKIGAIPTIAAGELALKSAVQTKILHYLPGDETFMLNDGVKLSIKQRKALTIIDKNMKKFGSTGVQSALEKLVFEKIGMIVVFPVEDENKYCNSKGIILPDAFLMPKGSTPKDLAHCIHTDLSKGFLYAIDARTKMRIKESTILKSGDVIRIVSTAK